MSALIVGLGGASVSAESPGQNIYIDFSSRGVTGPSPQEVYIYVKAGEQVKSTYTVRRAAATTSVNSGTIQLFGPSGYVSPVLAIDGTSAVGAEFTLDGPIATTDGVWKVVMQNSFGAPGGNLFIHWDIGTYSGATEQPGRAWTEVLFAAQASAAGQSDDITLYYLSNQGYVYRAMYRDYNGINSAFSTNSYGRVSAGNSCQSLYYSTASSYPVAQDPTSRDSAACGGRYKVFLNNPLLSGMPASAVDASGNTHWLTSPIQATTLSDLAYDHGGANTMAGDISVDVGNYAGNLFLRVDVNGDGDFTDAVDRTIQFSSNGGATTVLFDGKDGAGVDIPLYTKLSFQVEADRKGEIHFIRSDAEMSGGGIEVQRLNGSSVQPTVLFWDDSLLDTERCGTWSVNPMKNTT